MSKMIMAEVRYPDGTTQVKLVKPLPRRNKLSSLCKHRLTRRRLMDLIGEKL